jgi:hypothetical protein
MERADGTSRPAPLRPSVALRTIVLSGLPFGLDVTFGSRTRTVAIRRSIAQRDLLRRSDRSGSLRCARPPCDDGRPPARFSVYPSCVRWWPTRKPSGSSATTVGLAARPSVSTPAASTHTYTEANSPPPGSSSRSFTLPQSNPAIPGMASVDWIRQCGRGNRQFPLALARDPLNQIDRRRPGICHPSATRALGELTESREGAAEFHPSVHTSRNTLSAFIRMGPCSAVSRAPNLHSCEGGYAFMHLATRYSGPAGARAVPAGPAGCGGGVGSGGGGVNSRLRQSSG